MNARRGVVRIYRGRAVAVPPPPVTVPVRYFVVATVPKGPRVGSFEIINVDARRRPVTT